MGKRDVQIKQQQLVKLNKAQNSSLVLDGSNLIAGRLSTYVAKKLIEGHSIHVINADKVLLTGNRSSIISSWKKKLEIGSIVNPEKHGPFHKKHPHEILSKMIRGMLPRRKTHGLEAFRRLRVSVGSPLSPNINDDPLLEKAKANKPLSFYLTLGSLSQEFGWESDSK